MIASQYPLLLFTPLLRWKEEVRDREGYLQMISGRETRL